MEIEKILWILSIIIVSMISIWCLIPISKNSEKYRFHPLPYRIVISLILVINLIIIITSIHILWFE